MNTFAFSTLSCPEWDSEQILRAAVDCGYSAIEWRGYRDTLDLPQATPFLPSAREATRRRFTGEGIAFCCLSSSVTIAGDSPETRDSLRAYAELARAVQCPLIRIFGGSLPEDVPHGEAIARFADTLRGFGEIAEEFAVTLALETHDAFSTGATVAELLFHTAHRTVRALWDLHHPYRHGEEPSQTMHHLAPYLQYVHIKDGRDGTYTLPGEGDLPLAEMLHILKSVHYNGVISVEWEKRWHPDLAPPEVALPAYAAFLRGLA